MSNILYPYRKGKNPLSKYKGNAFYLHSKVKKARTDDVLNDQSAKNDKLVKGVNK